MTTTKYKRTKQACAITDKIFKELVDDFYCTTEKDIALFIKRRFRHYKVQSSYPPIVANNCASIHPKPRNRKLKRGFCVLDFGAKYKGYCSDMTRTLFLGTPTKNERYLYNLVLNCQQRCIKRIRPGIATADLGMYARKLLGKYKPFFRHALGHGIGKKVHESPRISFMSADKLKKGDMIAIEPGIYMKKGKKEVGIRVEDTIFVGKKAEILTKSPKQLINVKI